MTSAKTETVRIGQLLYRRLRRIFRPPILEVHGCSLMGEACAARSRPEHVRDPAVYTPPGGYILVGGGTASPRRSHLLLRDGMWIRALDDGGFLIEKAP